jgi:hypothetical protein
MDYAKDELKEQIEKARALLSIEAREAIDSVDWKSMIVGMRESKKFSFSQIETLGTETEKILAGLLSGDGYKKELKNKMGLPEEDLNKLVAEMNEKVFKKIKENLVAKLGENRNTTSIKALEIPQPAKLPEEEISHEDKEVFESAGISLSKPQAPEGKWAEGLSAPSEMIAQIENTDLIPMPKPAPIIAQKLTGHFQMPKVETKYEVNTSISPQKVEIQPVAKPSIPAVDPYRMSVDGE